MQIRDFLYLDAGTFGRFGLSVFGRQELGLGFQVMRNPYTFVYRVPHTDGGWGAMPWGHFNWQAHNVADREKPVAQLEAADTDVDLSHLIFDASTFHLNNNKTWQLAFADVSTCGRVSELSDYTRVVFDSDGVLLTPVGNAPISLSLAQLSRGRFRLSWSYNPDDQVVAPTGFRAFRLVDGVTTEQAQSVVYIPGRLRYNWTSESYTHGDTVVFLVRTYRTVIGVDHFEYNEDTVSGVADNLAPAAVDNIGVE